MVGKEPPAGQEPSRTIFMPLVTEHPRGEAAEDKDYRPVQAEWLGDDLYRVISEPSKNERWEYQSGAEVYAVNLHPGDTVVVIVAPFADPARPLLDEPPQLAPPSVGRARISQIVIMTIILVATALDWSRRGPHSGLQPADPIRASVIISCVIIIAGLWRVRNLPELRALMPSAAIAGAAFVLSLLVGRCQS